MSDLAPDETPSVTFGEEGSGLLNDGETSIPVRFHPLAQLFPMIEGEAFAALVEDVKTRGVRRPIVLFEGMVLDGRNRYLAAREAGVGYPVVDFTGDDPVAFVVSENIHRRHLTESQRALVAGKLAKLPAHRPEKGANLHPSAASAAVMLNVSERSVKSAQAVVRSGTPELVQMVETDQASVSAAAEVAKLPEDIQTEVVEAGPEAVKDTAKVIREDATVMERLEAGDPETVATVRAQIMDAVANPAPRAPRPSRANPHHEPNPARQDAATIADCAVQIAEAFDRRGPGVIDALKDNLGTYERTIAKVERARDALNAILEAADD